MTSRLRNLWERACHFSSRINLDDPRFEKCARDVQTNDFEFDDENIILDPVWFAFQCILSQSVMDRAICLHIFADHVDSCLRIQQYVPVPENLLQQPWSDPSAWLGSDKPADSCAGEKTVLELAWEAQPDAREVFKWCEMMPLPLKMKDQFFRHFRDCSSCWFGRNTGKVHVKRHERRMLLVVEFVGNEECRLYFSKERPAIREKPSLPC